MGGHAQQPVRLSLGSGDKAWPGFVNVDLYGEPDVRCDVRKLLMPNDYAMEIHAIHLFEHLDRMEAQDALKEWARVLIPGGKLVLELPCLDKIMTMYMEGERNYGLIQFGLFGDPRPRNAAMLHKWCWTVGEMKEELILAGFTGIAFEEPKFHVARRDMRVVALKGA